MRTPLKKRQFIKDGEPTPIEWPGDLPSALAVTICGSWGAEERAIFLGARQFVEKAAYDAIGAALDSVAEEKKGD